MRTSHPTHSFGRIWLVLLAAMVNTPCFASSTDKSDEVELPPVYEVNRGALKIKIELDGVFQAAEMTPIRIAPKAWGDLTVIEAVPHGATVEQGDKLVTLETEKIEEQITDLEQDRPSAKLALDLAAAELVNLRETTPLRLDTAKKSRRIASEELDYFEDTARAEREKRSSFSITNSMHYLDGQREELAQLEKMYKADHLTEETEEIVLRRQKFEVEAAEFNLGSIKLNSEREVKVTLPRELDRLQTAKREQDLALALAENTMPQTLAKKELDVEKLKRDQRKSAKRLKELKQDLKSMEVTAPMDGIVYYGLCENGRWTTAPAVAKKLVPGGKLAPYEVFMTVVNPDKLLVKATVPESELQYISSGLQGEVSPALAPAKKLEVEVLDVQLVPLPSGAFEATLEMENTGSLRLMPGMSCKVRFVDVKKEGVLLAPKSAVFTEEKEQVVYLAEKDGKSVRRVVKTGGSDDSMIEILEGVSEGDEIMTKKPE